MAPEPAPTWRPGTAPAFCPAWTRGRERLRELLEAHAYEVDHPWIRTGLSRHALRELASELPEDEPTILGCLLDQGREPPAGRRGAMPARGASRVGRNDPCPCGSGRKHKRCCGA